MVSLDVREIWKAKCHETPQHRFCCCCYRDQHHQHQFENERLLGAIRSALEDFDRRDELSAVDTLRAALSGAMSDPPR